MRRVRHRPLRKPKTQVCEPNLGHPFQKENPKTHPLGTKDGAAFAFLGVVRKRDFAVGLAALTERTNYCPGHPPSVDFARKLAYGYAFMWMHLVNLLVRSWSALMRASSQSTFGFIVFGCAVPVFTGLLALIYFRWIRKQVWPQVARNSLLPMAFGLGAVVIVVAGVYIRSIIYVIYDDHQHFVAANKELPSKNSEIEHLKLRLTEFCYMPDRRIKAEQHEVLYKALKLTADKYHHPRVVVGFFDGDTESVRYFGDIYTLLKNAGFKMDKDPVVRRPHNKASDPPDPGLSEGLSIQEEIDTPASASHPRQELVMAIFQDFVNSGVEMQQYAPPTVKASDPIIIWVGAKKIDYTMYGK